MLFLLFLDLPFSPTSLSSPQYFPYSSFQSNLSHHEIDQEMILFWERSGVYSVIKGNWNQRF